MKLDEFANKTVTKAKKSSEILSGKEAYRA